MNIINELFPKSNFTVVGDLNQSLNPYANIGNGEMWVRSILKFITYKLTKSYRSTQQITKFVNKILGVEHEDGLINRNGNPQ